MKKLSIILAIVIAVAFLIFGGWSWCGQHPEHANAASWNEQA